jgi:hypothetical protein
VIYVGKVPTLLGTVVNIPENMHSVEEISHAKAQRRKALPRSSGFLCAFAPLREKFPELKALR